MAVDYAFFDWNIFQIFWNIFSNVLSVRQCLCFLRNEIFPISFYVTLKFSLFHFMFSIITHFFISQTYSFLWSTISQISLEFRNVLCAWKCAWAWNGFNLKSQEDPDDSLTYILSHNFKANKNYFFFFFFYNQKCHRVGFLPKNKITHKPNLGEIWTLYKFMNNFNVEKGCYPVSWRKSLMSRPPDSASHFDNIENILLDFILHKRFSVALSNVEP